MRRIRSKDTGPELELRRSLHAEGLRYQLHVRGLPGTPDIVFPRALLAIQVRGCFWHFHDCKVGHIPKSRSKFWREKLQGNKARDVRNDAALSNLGWMLVVVWECEIAEKGGCVSAAKSIALDVRRRRRNL
jgi:DNA mismatch endonuclease (patch repair protein)